MRAVYFFISIVFVFFHSLGAHAEKATGQKPSLDEKIRIAKERCTPKTHNELTLYRNDVRTDILQNLQTMSDVYTSVYNSTRRLPHRAAYSSDQKGFVSTDGELSVNFPDAFMKTVILHVENALRFKHADFIFFPDMGHSHFLIPQDFYDKELADAEGSFWNTLDKLVQNPPPNLKTLYHTAEHLKTHTDRARTELVADQHTQWRFYTRNPVIDLRGHIEIHTNLEGSKANTVHKVEGHRFTAGFNISASKHGCFPFEDATGEIQYFDISAWDLAADCSRTDCNSEF